MVAMAAGGGAELVVLPERRLAAGAATVPSAAEELDDLRDFLSGIAASTGTAVCGSMTAVGEGAATTTTMLLAESSGAVNESRQPGHDARFSSFEIADVRLTPVGGVNLIDPVPFRACADQTDVFIVCADEAETRRVQWEALLSARAIENQCYVVGANRVGNAGGSVYLGDSRIVDPQGSVLTTSAGIESILTADVQPAIVRFTRERSPRSKMVLHI